MPSPLSGRQISELESSLAGSEEDRRQLADALSQLEQYEHRLQSSRQEAAGFQSQLAAQRVQLETLERKYQKAKRLIREFQRREAGLLSQEEYHQGREREYDRAVRALHERLQLLERQLAETQREAGLPVQLPAGAPPAAGGCRRPGASHRRRGAGPTDWTRPSCLTPRALPTRRRRSGAAADRYELDVRVWEGCREPASQGIGRNGRNRDGVRNRMYGIYLDIQRHPRYVRWLILVEVIMTMSIGSLGWQGA